MGCSGGCESCKSAVPYSGCSKLKAEPKLSADSLKKIAEITQTARRISFALWEKEQEKTLMKSVGSSFAERAKTGRL
jgi:hypothetical protein